MSLYRLAIDAERDLVEIANYISGKTSLAMAEHQISEIVERIILLASHPAAGRNEERYGMGTRSLPVGKYKIYYRPRKRGIVVLHIFHGARDQEQAWKNTAVVKKTLRK